ncbi:hypothetical protein [Salipiger sp. PrR003]|uniref:hypothetical protein n=1 Tax=Salipiger sp. PrR003 TaxID=2706776 RepID=UPI0013DB12CD|nr:hypothetical protein [Salipiger sp. PrR003]NDV53015.1 hypothetical protein [Salipiger sp. PrR003]
MKTFIAGTVIALTIASSALAATEEQAAMITQYAPDVDVASMTDEQVAEAFAIANSSVNDAQKEIRITFVANNVEPPRTFSDDQISLIEEYVDPSEVMMMSGQQKADALALISGGSSREEVTGELEAMIIGITPALTPAEAQQVNTYVTGADIAALTEEQVGEIRGVIYSQEGDGQKRERLQQIMK